jgi:hypothetical protein
MFHREKNKKGTNGYTQILFPTTAAVVGNKTSVLNKTSWNMCNTE